MNDEVQRAVPAGQLHCRFLVGVLVLAPCLEEPREAQVVVPDPAERVFRQRVPPAPSVLGLHPARERHVSRPVTVLRDLVLDGDDQIERVELGLALRRHRDLGPEHPVEFHGRFRVERERIAGLRGSEDDLVLVGACDAELAGGPLMRLARERRGQLDGAGEDVRAAGCDLRRQGGSCEEVIPVPAAHGEVLFVRYLRLNRCPRRGGRIRHAQRVPAPGLVGLGEGVGLRREHLPVCGEFRPHVIGPDGKLVEVELSAAASVFELLDAHCGDGCLAAAGEDIDSRRRTERGDARIADLQSDPADILARDRGER